MNNVEYTKIKLNNNDILVEPYNYKDIFKLKDKNEWLKSVNEELNNMKKLKVYIITKTSSHPEGYSDIKGIQMTK